MNLIAAVDRNWAIGKAGRELVNIPEDKKFFREETTGKVIVMGRKTFESLPGAMALAGRTNIVLSENPGFAPKNTIVCRSFEETKEELPTAEEANEQEEIFQYEKESEGAVTEDKVSDRGYLYHRRGQYLQAVSVAV